MTTFQKVIKYLAIALALSIIVSIFAGILECVAIFGGFSGQNAVKEQSMEYNVSQDLTSLKIDINAAELTITSSDRFSVSSNLKRLSVTEKDGCLIIEESDRNGNNYNDAVLSLSIPAGIELESIDITTGAGRFTADSLKAKRLNMEFGAGEVVIGELRASESAELDGGAGKITVSNGSMCDLDLNMGVGELNVSAELLGECDLDLGVGQTNLILYGTLETYGIRFDKGLGSITVNGQGFGDGSSFGSGSNRIEIDGGVGAINITVTEK